MLNLPQTDTEDQTVEVSLEAVRNIRDLYLSGKATVKNFVGNLSLVFDKVHSITSQLKAPASRGVVKVPTKAIGKMNFHYVAEQNIPVPMGFNGNLVTYLDHLHTLLIQTNDQLVTSMKDTDARLTVLHNETSAYKSKYPIGADIAKPVIVVTDDRSKYFTDFKQAMVSLSTLVGSKDELKTMERHRNAVYDVLMRYQQFNFNLGKLSELDKRIKLMEPTLKESLENETILRSQLVDLLSSIDETLSASDQLVSVATDAWAAMSVCNSIYQVIESNS